MKSALVKIENFSRHMDTKMKWQLKKNCSFWTFTLWKFSPSNISISAEHLKKWNMFFIEEQNRLSFISFSTFTTDARSKNLNKPKLFLTFHWVNQKNNRNWEKWFFVMFKKRGMSCNIVFNISPWQFVISI